MDGFGRNTVGAHALFGAVIFGFFAAACPAGDDGSASTEGNDTSATMPPGADDTPDPSATSSTPTTTNDPSTTTPSSDTTGPVADTGSEGGSSSDGGDPATMPCQAAEVVTLPGVALAADGSAAAGTPVSGHLQDDPDPFEGDTGIGFIPEPDGGVGSECDTFAQDCPVGQKCMPWANDGGSVWNATRCSPIAADPGAPGDSCMVEGSAVSGVDDCALGAMCFGTDNATQMGTCIEMCGGSSVAPVCDTPATTCVVTNSGVLALCRPLCNPLAGECPAGQGCYVASGVPVCAGDASGQAGAGGDPCEFINGCDDGQMCAPAESVPDCAGQVACCSPFCAVGDDSACLPGQTCQPFYPEGEAPLECVAELGVCLLP